MMMIILCFPYACFSETHDWEDYSKPFADEISLSETAAVTVLLPDDILDTCQEISLAIDVLLTTGYGTVYLTINDAAGEKRLVSRDESHETVIQIPTAAFKHGANTLFFFDEKGFAGNMIRRLEFRIPVLDQKDVAPGENNPETSKPPEPVREAPIAIPEASRSKIAVIQFSSLNRGDEDKHLGPMIAEMFTTELVRINAYKIIEREQLTKVLTELSLVQTGVLDSGDVQRVGKILGTDAIVTGSVIKIGDTLRIDSRVIDVGTGVILTAESRVVKLDLHAIESGVREMTLGMTRRYYDK
jgi:TolB-like protein